MCLAGCHRTLQRAVKLPYCIPFMLHDSLGELAGFAVQHGYALLPCMEISLQFSSRPPSSRAFGWTPKSLLGPL